MNNKLSYFFIPKAKPARVCFLSLLLLSLLSFTTSCSSYGENFEKQTNYQSQTGERINQSQKNTNPLFDELEE